MDLDIPQARASLAFRTALSVVLCGFVTYWFLSTRTSHDVFTYSEAALAPIFAFMMPATLHGDTCKVSLTWITSAFLLVPLGIGTSFLCFLLGGYQWNPWILSIGLSAMVFLVVIWGAVASVLHAPKVLLAGNPVALLYALLCPILAFLKPVSHRDILLDTACLTASILAGAVISLIFSHLPFGLGAASARQQAPALGAEKLASLAETFEAVAIWQRRDGGSLQRHRECRLRLIKASHGFRTACSSAAFELWDLKSSGSFQGGESSLEVLSKESESCRLALQMKARMVTLGLSPLSMELFFSGVTGEAMRDCCFMAAKALRHASARLLELGGRPPPGQVPAAPWLTSPNVTAEDCQVAAAECRDMLTRYKDVWSSMYLDDAPHSWKARLEESVTLGITNGKPKEEFFLDGSYHLRTVLEAQHQEEALVAAFDEASRNAASLVGVCTAAESAATLAELVATASPKAPRCGCAAPRVTGIQHWLSAPFAGLKAWQKGFAKGKSFAFRVSFAILLTSLLKDLIPVNSLWPSKDGSSWTLFTIALITTPVQGATLLRGMRRGLGTVVGSVLAVASVALLGAAPTFRALWCQVFVMAFGLKFFEPEMQYAGAVTFVTYQIVLSSLADKLIEDNELVLPMPKAVDIAVRRCVDVLVGIVVATVVSIFLAPDRGIDELRDRENEALKCAVTALRRAGAVLAATAAGQPRDATEDEEAWTELRNEVWTSFEALNFAGDGQPGVGDVLEDARWEGRWGVDGGFLVLGGLLWLPRCCFRCCGRRKKPSSRKCLQAVVAISRLLRIVNMLVAMLQEGLGEDAGLPLANDPRVLQALGTNGEALAESLDAALGVASAMLTGQSGGKVEPVMADLEERNRLLLLGAGASRKKAGGLARNQNLGGLRAAAAIKLLDISLRALGESLRSLEGHRAEHSTASKNASSDRSTSPSSLSAEPSHEESTEQIDLEEGQIRV